MLESDQFEGTHEGIEMSLEQYDEFLKIHGSTALSFIEKQQEEIKNTNLFLLAKAGILRL